MITYKPLTPKRWDDLEALFGKNGACGGCWCMWWRRPKGEKWDAVKGAANKRRFRDLVRAGKVRGVLAYDGAEAVGWLQYGPRLDFPALERARTLACDDAERVWSINCLFVQRRYRNQGVSQGMIADAVERMRAEGAPVIEAYPVKPKRGETIPAAFAYTGTLPMFRRAGFKPVGARDISRQRVRLTPGRRG